MMNPDSLDLVIHRLRQMEALEMTTRLHALSEADLNVLLRHLGVGVRPQMSLQRKQDALAEKISQPHAANPVRRPTRVRGVSNKGGSRL